MAAENFDQCFKWILVHEGGFTADKRDRGNDGDGHGNQGSTNLGVTAKVWAEYTGGPAPIEVMKKLTPADVAPLYKKNYWSSIRADDLPSGVDWVVMDFCVNSGVNRASRYLQTAVLAKADGNIGPKTLSLVERRDPKNVIADVTELRETFLRRLKAFPIYGRGWIRRTTETYKQALELANH